MKEDSPFPLPFSDVIPDVETEKSTVSDPRLSALREQIAQEENLTRAAFTIRINHAKLGQVTIQEPKEGIGIRDSKEAAAQLNALLERVKKLPERLEFKPGITLIIGENGSGKSTLAKAFYLVAEYQQNLRFFAEEEDTFDEAGRKAQRITYKPSAGSVGKRLWLTQAGLASIITQAMVAEEYKSFKTSGMGVEYYDFTEVMGNQGRNEFDYAVERALRRDDFSFQGWEDHTSHRQTVDRLLTYELQRNRKWYKKPQVYFLDEPETGMSPWRQLNIEKEILDCTTPNSIVIIPTSNLVLFQSDLPRIDLRYPERGIHRPSDFEGN